MSTARPVESRLPEILEGISAPRTPDYFDDILGQVSRTRQRPGWSFPERWLPMTALSERVATAPRIPMRMAVVLALLLLGLVVSIVLIAGSQRPAVPAPFGVAGNGEIVFADTTGAIVAGNVGDGTTKVIVPGSGHSRPVFSPEGRSLAYLQRRLAGGSDIVVSNADSGSPRVVNAHPVGDVGHFGWTPDSKAVVAGIGAAAYAFPADSKGDPKTIVEGDGVSNFNYLDAQNNVIGDLFRPPNGDEILVVKQGGGATGLYRRLVSGGELIPVITAASSPVPLADVVSPQWSPDGTKIVFSLHSPSDPNFGRAYVINADGSDLKQVSPLPTPSDAVIDEEHTAWSPDGTRIAFGRWFMYPDGSVDPRPVIVVNLTTGADLEMSNREVNGYGGWFWSPDGKSILEMPNDQSEHAGQVLVVDATTGELRTLGWTGDFSQAPSWQRTAPKS